MRGTSACPCGSARSYDGCCGRLHSGIAQAETAEELMRARYSAFVAGEASYLLRTWHPATRPDSLDLDDRVRWTALEVLASEGGGPTDHRGSVEFLAHHVVDGRAATLHERSRFRRDAEGWQYVRGRATWS